jgi:guanylate kinase
MSVSATTRPMRPGEIDGHHYHFIDKARFQSMQAAGEFLEWAEVFGNHYGTPRGPVEAALSEGRDILFDIDWQGTQQLRSKGGTDVVGVFILPPSVVALEKRLRTRAQDSDAVIAGRMSRAGEELSHYGEYDYVIVNRDVEEAYRQVEAVLIAERARRERMVGVDEFVRGLRAQV